MAELPGVRRAITILETLALRREGLAFNEIAESLADAPPSTISRLLKVLQDEDLICKSDGKQYALSARSRRLGRLLSGTTSVQDLAVPVVQDLADETMESAAYYLFVDDAVQIIAKAEKSDSFHYGGLRAENRNFDRNLFGQLCLSHQDEATIRRTLENATMVEPIQQSSFRTLLDELRREDVVALRKKIRHSPVMRVAAPVFVDGRFAGAIGVSFFGDNVAEDVVDSLKAAVRTAAVRLGRDLQTLNQLEQQT